MKELKEATFLVMRVWTGRLPGVLLYPYDSVSEHQLHTVNGYLIDDESGLYYDPQWKSWRLVDLKSGVDFARCKEEEDIMATYEAYKPKHEKYKESEEYAEECELFDYINKHGPKSSNSPWVDYNSALKRFERKLKNC